jgi:hypothetical protein
LGIKTGGFLLKASVYKFKIALKYSNKFRADLKYVLQLLSSHPDNEQLKIDIEDDYDGIKRMDFEILLNVSL